MAGVLPGREPLLEVGRVARPHGLAGAVVVELVTDRTERLEPGSVLSSDTGTLVVRSCRPLGGRYLVHFEGVTSRTEAERLRGRSLRAAPLSVPEALWVHELIGSEVVTTAGRRLGPVEAVEANPASDLLVLPGGVLVPLRFVVARRPGGELTVEIPDGLLE